MVKAARAHGFVPSRGVPQASTLTPLSRPFRHRFGSVQASPPRLYVSVSPSPVSREANRDLWRSIGPSEMVVFKIANVAVSASTASAKIMDDLIFMFRTKTTFISPTYLTWTTQQRRALFDQRGRKTADLHTSGVKLAETWRGGVKW